MKIHNRFLVVAIAVAGVLGAGSGFTVLAHRQSSMEQDRMAIERLHRLDVEATLSNKADELAKLWDNDAVRIEPGRPAEVGKTVIYAHDNRSGTEHILCYNPEIQDLQIAGDWAFEWDYFSYKSSANSKTVAGRGKALRVLKRQPDGSWKFARIMVFPEKLESAAPVSHPCE